MVNSADTDQTAFSLSVYMCNRLALHYMFAWTYLSVKENSIPTPQMILFIKNRDTR